MSHANSQATTENLAGQSCAPCRGETEPLKGQDLQEYMSQLEGWDLHDEHHITKTWKLDDFAQALKFTNRIGELAEQEDHHPTITLTYGKVTVELATHKIDGLSPNDFILAAKIDGLD